MPSSFRLQAERNAGKDENREMRVFSLQPTLTVCKNVLTVAPETQLSILEVEIGTFLKRVVSLLGFFSVLCCSSAFTQRPFLPSSEQITGVWKTCTGSW